MKLDDLVPDSALIREYDGVGPRYTSYPTADRFVEAFDAHAYSQWLQKRNIGGISKPLSLYVHLPFCNTICYYCACNKIITKDHGRSAKYIKYLGREIALQNQFLDGDRDVAQLHWGGGTPTFLSHEEMRELMGVLRQNFKFAKDGEYSIEIDPRKVTQETIAVLAALGFNRISLGVQDFDPLVQRAVNRIQSEEETLNVISAARGSGFKSVSLDLIYGLPKQTLEGFARTLDKVIAANPDRIALYSYAHLPGVFKPQRRILEADLPHPEVKLQLLIMAIEHFIAAGYRYIGLDHFAKPSDELAVAQRQGRLHRNFQGYSTHADCDLLAFGITAIGKVGPIYSQNVRTLDEYYDRLDQNILPVMRGIELSADDLLRRTVIHALMCHFAVSVESIEIAYLIDFDSYFATEIEALRPLQQAGLVEFDGDWLCVTPQGRLLVRRVCMVFDKYLRADEKRATYSKVI